MSVRKLVERSRSYRRFYEDVPVDHETLRQLIDLARLSASGRNVQPLKYAISCDQATNELVFPCLAWAGYLDDWDGPGEGERPAAYIVIVNDRNISKSCGCDHGIAAQSIMLGAAEIGLGGCMIGSIQREKLGKVLGLEEHLEIILVLALGKPKEEVIIETIGPDGDIKYWRDAKGSHHVPKRALDDIVIS